jgi:ribA/ribD-fused uncharacterized protein
MKEENKQKKYTFFFRSESPFSQWHPSKFIVDDVKFENAEMFMMWKKAMAFSDFETADKIIACKHPREAKELGRSVKNFKKEVWDELSKRVVYSGNYAKFTQNKHLLSMLMNTGSTKFVEASPYDKVWGCGLDEEQAKNTPEERWPGKNQLGEILTRLREDLRNRELF